MFVTSPRVECDDVCSMMTSRSNKLEYRHFYCFDVNRVKSFMMQNKQVSQPMKLAQRKE